MTDRRHNGRRKRGQQNSGAFTPPPPPVTNDYVDRTQVDTYETRDGTDDYEART